MTNITNTSMTLKCVLGVFRGHWKWRQSIDHIQLTIGLPMVELLDTRYRHFCF